MRVTIVGTGNMARGVAARVLAGGHQVTFVGTDVSKAEDLADEMTSEGPVGASERIDAAVVVLAVPYTQAPHVVRHYAAQLDGAVVIDVTNPVDISVLEPLRGGYVEPFDSGAQLIAAEAPDGARVVKAFNTTFAGTLLAGEVAGQPLDVFNRRRRRRGQGGRQAGSSPTAACARSAPARSHAPASSRGSVTCTWPSSPRWGPRSPRP